MSLRTRLAIALASAALLGGCGSTAIDEHYDDAQRLARERLGAELRWLRSDKAQRQAQSDVDAALAQPLSADDAVRIALSYSPALQAALFDNAAESASATQSARLPNPVFAFERLARGSGDARELEITRVLTLPLIDLLLLPSRMQQASLHQQQLRWRLSCQVVQAATQARSAWVRAVAAEQALRYAEQVKDAADASAELARRMEAAGNFSRLQRAREQAFSADAVAQLSRAQQNARATKEALVRTLGLRGPQVAKLKLPDQLPDLPANPRDERQSAQAGLDQRLDIAQAKAELEFTAREQGLSKVTGLVNGLELGAANKSTTNQPTQRGYDLSLPLPVFDAGDAARAQAQARYGAALQRTAAVAVQAESQVREAHASYLAAYALARHYRDEVVPLHKTIGDENLLRYNAMQIGVFELLADAREQVASVVQSLDAQRDFWLADAALQAALIGVPTSPIAARTEAP
jgi:outer membrane protein TolC